MPDVFLLKLLIGFLVGNVWITIVTIIAERFGSKIGGFLGGLPSTMLLSLFFIGWTQSSVIASQATTVIPVVIGLNALAVAAYATFARKSFVGGLLAFFLVWFAVSFSILLLNIENYIFSLVIWLAMVVSSYYILEKKLKIKSKGKFKIKYRPLQIISRAIFSGSIIALAVVASKFGGATIGGIFSTFPATFISGIIITYYSRGVEFSKAISKSLMLSASLTVIVYVTSVRFLYPSFNLVIGTIVAYLITMAAAYFVYNFFSRMR